MKNFNDYLNRFTEMDMWEQVFPGSTINKNLVESSDFIVIITNLFRNEPIEKLENKLVQDYRIELEIAKKVVFLLYFDKLIPDNVLETYKRKEQCSIRNSSILEWIRVNSISDPVKIKFLKYKPSVSSQDLMDKGFKGRELGSEIKRLEIEKFKEIL